MPTPPPPSVPRGYQVRSSAGRSNNKILPGPTALPVFPDRREGDLCPGRNKIPSEATSSDRDTGPQKLLLGAAARTLSREPTPLGARLVEETELRRVFREELHDFFHGLQERLVLRTHADLAHEKALALAHFNDAAPEAGSRCKETAGISNSALTLNGNGHHNDQSAVCNGTGNCTGEQVASGDAKPARHESWEKEDSDLKEHADRTYAAASSGVDANVAIEMLESTPLAPLGKKAGEYIKKQEPKREGRLARFVQGPYFGVMVAAIIVANAFFQIYTTNYRVAHLGQPLPNACNVVEVLFLVAYLTEIGLKLSVHRMFFFWNDDMYWNCFDVFLVVISATTVLSIYTEASGPNLSYLRIMRFLKLGKLLRVVRLMHIIRDLRLIVSSIMGSMTSFLWSMAMFAIVFFVFGTLFVDAFAACEENGCAGLDPDSEEVLLSRFGSVQNAMVTMFQAITGGDDWSRFYHALNQVGAQYGLVYIFFIAFCNFALMNILTGIFMENAMNLAKPDREAIAFMHRQQENNQIRSLTSLFKEMDNDGSGKMKLDEFLNVIKINPMVTAFFHEQGLDIRDAEIFFRMLQDADHEGEPVEIDAFVDGCMKMKGGATSLDIQALRFRLRDMRKSQVKFYKEIIEKMNALAACEDDPAAV